MDPGESSALRNEDSVVSNPSNNQEDDDASVAILPSNNTSNIHQQPLPTNEDDDAQIIIIGGWLGSGPLAASDTWVLDISSGLSNLRWFQPPLKGTPPGPCNMHSADYIPPKSEVYVFRGGNGREYLNDLHALNVSTYEWRRVETAGNPPQQRANHSSAVLEYNNQCELFIFGGWNGTERLNDIYILDTESNTWTEPRVGGIKPHPRAGMTLTALRGRLYLFGGSGTSSKCFDDLQILDRQDMVWLDVNDEKDESGSGGNSKERNGVVVSNGNSRENDSLDWYMVGLGEGSSSTASFSVLSEGSGSSLGGQDGMMGDNGNTSDRIFADWRSQEIHHPDSGQHQSLGSSLACTSANPNDFDNAHSVFVSGNPPGKRAGHTATAVGRFIYVFGGSCGQEYLSDFFVLDTDPPPAVQITEPTSSALYARRLAHFYNDEEFSDVIFIVEGKRVYGHKLVLSTVSDCFRAMFMTGFRESGSGCTEIEIPDTNYDIFLSMMEYIYTGKGPKINVSEADGIDRAIALLELSDQFFLYNLKQICEGLLQPAVTLETYSFLMSVAQKTNSAQLELYCRYFERNVNEIVVD
jgi:N-acetylneuraminic acid mutarotase